MKVISQKSISFPKIPWAISAGEERELPEDRDAQERILAEPEIRFIGKEKGEKVGEEEKITSTNKK
jgi:hypothetical protein